MQLYHTYIACVLLLLRRRWSFFVVVVSVCAKIRGAFLLVRAVVATPTAPALGAASSDVYVNLCILFL